MDEDAVVTGLVTVETSGLFTRHHRLLAGGHVLGELVLGMVPSVTYTDAEGRQLRLGRPSFWRGEYKMWEGDIERASALLRPFRRQIEVTCDGQPLLLQPTGLTSRAWELADAAGEPLLTVRRSGWGRAEIAVHAPVGSDLLAFAYYLVVVRWRAAHRRRVG